MLYQFDGIVLDAAAMRLSRGGEELALEPKSFRLLQFLIENRERVVGKDEILRVVWEETAVTDNALTRAVAQIRKVLEDDPRAPKYIDTVPTVGYRFIGVVIEGATQPGKTPASRGGRMGFGWLKRAGLWSIALFAVLMVLVIVAWRWARPKTNAASDTMPVPLTSERGIQDGPSFSPDGNQVAFEWNGEKEDNFDIYVKVVGSDAAPLRLTSDPLPDLAPSWSPDGRVIAFERVLPTGRVALVLIPALGGPERRLAEFQDNTGDPVLSRPAWSGDSKWMVVSQFSEGKMRLMRVSVESGEATTLMNPPGALEDILPSLSPDGGTLMFTRHATYNWGDVYQVGMDANGNVTGTEHRIPTGPVSIGRAIWTADGKEIIALTRFTVLRMPAEGSDNPQTIAWMGTSVNRIDLSAHSGRMAYVVVHGDSNVWRIDLTAKTPQPQRWIASVFRDVYPQYSPDGRRIAFYSDRGGGRGQIWVSDAEGRQARQLTFVKTGQAATPHWSPDGKMLAIDSNETGASQVYLLNPEGGRMMPLTQGPAVNFGAVWSHDGRWLYFTSQRTGRNEVWKMPGGGGDAVQVTRNRGAGAVESPDGKTLYYTKDSGVGSIWRMPVEGGPEEQVVTSLFRNNYAVTKRGLYWMTALDERGLSTVMFYNFATGASSTVMAMGRPEYGLDVSPDGRYLLYAQMDDPGSNLMLVENFH